MRQKISRRKKALAIAAVGIGSVLLLATDALSGGAAGADAPGEVAATVARPLPVETIEAEPAFGFDVERSYTGELVAHRRSSLAFERLGLLVEILVDDGRTVGKGELLARLDDRHLELSRDRVAASLSQARALLDELVAGPRSQTVAAARAEVAELDAQLAWAAVRKKRREDLISRNALAREEAEAVGFETDTLTARRRAAAARLDELEEGTRSEQVAAQRARVAELEARIAEIELDISKSRMIAPFDGRVARRIVDEGAVLAPGAAVMELVETGVLEARIGLPAFEDVGWSPGGAVQLDVDGRSVPGRFRGYETDLDRATRSRVAIIDVEEAAGLFPGRIVRVKRSRRVGESGFWLPRTALVKSIRGLWACLVAVDEGGETVVRRRALEILHDTENVVFVRGTLEPGERVVRDGSHRIVDGQVVDVREDAR